MASSAAQPAQPNFFERSMQRCCGSASWLGRTVVHFVTQTIIKYRDPIFYVAIALLVCAVVFALFKKFVVVFVLIGCSFLLFALAAWAFRNREKKLAEELGVENARLLTAVQDGQKTLEGERKTHEEVVRKRDELQNLTAQQSTELEQLRATNEEHQKRLQELDGVNRGLQEENAKLHEMEDKVNRLLGPTFGPTGKPT
ncbi:MAG: hypothetical protein JSS32_00040 [Verrucomicrobia bacterium]|nr:hypothetical protein [Verrucomicrobiota bacterium]